MLIDDWHDLAMILAHLLRCSLGSSLGVDLKCQTLTPLMLASTNSITDQDVSPTVPSSTTSSSSQQPHILHRESQSRALTSALLQSYQPPLPGICNKTTTPNPVLFIHGDLHSGKQTTLSAVLNNMEQGTDVAMVDCIECYSLPILLQSILSQFHKSCLIRTDAARDNKMNGLAGLPITCTNVDQFIKALASMSSTSRHRIVVFQSAQALTAHPTLLQALFHTQAYLQAASSPAGITFVLVSTLNWYAFAPHVPDLLTPPHALSFPSYTSAQLLDILVLPCHIPPQVLSRSNRVKGEERTFLMNTTTAANTVSPEYMAFCKLVLDSLKSIESDVLVLRGCLWRLWPMYWQPVVQGKCEAGEVSKLAHMIRPELAKLMRHGVSDVVSTFASDERAFDLQLPYYTKFLLIASFLASYNPPRLDTRFFSRTGTDKRRKVGGTNKEGGRLRQQLLGPRPFPEDRMLAIFYSLLDSDVPGSVDIQQQISSLLTLRLLIKASPDGRLDAMKLKCVVDYDRLKGMAASVGFEVDKYLHDFS